MRLLVLMLLIMPYENSPTRASVPSTHSWG